MSQQPTTTVWRNGPAAAVKLPEPAEFREVGAFFNGNTRLKHMASGGGDGPRPMNGLQLALGRMFYVTEKLGENAWYASNRISNGAAEVGELVGYAAVTLVGWVAGDKVGKMIFPAHPILGGLVFGLAGWYCSFKADRWLEEHTNLGGRSKYRLLSASLGSALFEKSTTAAIAAVSYPAMWVGKNGQKMVGYNPWRDPNRPKI